MRVSSVWGTHQRVVEVALGSGHFVERKTRGVEWEVQKTSRTQHFFVRHFVVQEGVDVGGASLTTQVLDV